MGDFNAVFEGEHRVGGKMVTESETRDDKDLMERKQLDFIKLERFYFSWHDNVGIFSIFDHTLGNKEWHVKFVDIGEIFKLWYLEPLSIGIRYW